MAQSGGLVMSRDNRKVYRLDSYFFRNLKFSGNFKFSEIWKCVMSIKKDTEWLEHPWLIVPYGPRTRKTKRTSIVGWRGGERRDSSMCLVTPLWIYFLQWDMQTKPQMRGRTASEKLLAHSFIYSFIKKIEPLNVYWEHGVCHIMCPGPWRHNDRRNTVSAFAEYVIQSRRRTKTK